MNLKLKGVQEMDIDVKLFNLIFKNIFQILFLLYQTLLNVPSHGELKELRLSYI